MAKKKKKVPERLGQQKEGNNGISRREFVKKSSALAAGAVLGTVGFPYIVRAKTKKFLKPIVMATWPKPGDPPYEMFATIPKILKEKYDIELEIIIHHSGTLGTDYSALDACQHGFTDIGSNSTANWAPYTDAWNFCDLPYTFLSSEHGERFLKSDLMKKCNAKAEKDMPVKVLPPIGAGGYRLLWNNKRELRTPDDVQALRFRTIRSPAAPELIKSWGGNPTSVAFVELYMALQQGVIDGIHVQPVWVQSAKLYEVLKYATQVKAIWSIQVQVININTWNSMPKDIQNAFWAAAEEAADMAHKLDKELEKKYMQTLIKEGMKIYEPTKEEYNKWYEKGLEVQRKFKVDPDTLRELERLIP